VASRAELREMCNELLIDSEGLSIIEMKAAVRKEADRRLKSKYSKHSADKLSESLRRFLVLEYNYKLRNKEGKVFKYVAKNRRVI
jgi:hypothetical protein